VMAAHEIWVMKKLIGSGPYLYAAAMAVFGIIQLITQNFLAGLLPVPASMPLRWFWMILSSAIFLLVAAGIFFKIRPQIAAVIAGLLFTLFLLVLDLPVLLGHLYSGGNWAATFEDVMLASGGFIIAAVLPNELPWSLRWNKVIGWAAVVGHYLFALSLVIFLIQHFIYYDYIVSLIPDWLPVKLFWADVVIAGYFLSSVCFVIGRKIALAATWLGIMFGLWVIVLHAPRAIGKWNNANEWASLFVAMGVCGVAFAIARRESTAPARVIALKGEGKGEGKREVRGEGRGEGVLTAESIQ
jgi:hypothetical protein